MIKLLWTSGWDSTFRLLQLVAEKKVHVEPYYLIDAGRSSTSTEVRTLSKIKRLIQEHDPEASSRIAPFKFYSVDEIQENRDITHSYQTLKSISYIGGQYDWLARFVDQHGISELELSVHRDDTVFVFLNQVVNRVDSPSVGEVYELGNLNEDKDIANVFGGFRFPMLYWTKVEMEEHSRCMGWTEIMDETWFCHRPISNRPCGLCNPCRYTIAEGMGKRLPKKALLRHRFRKLFDVRSSAKKFLARLK